MQGTGYIARGVKRRVHSWLTRGDKPKNESEFKELTVEHCTTMAPQLVGKPIKFAHKDSKFGIVTASRFSEDSGDWEIDFEVSNDNPYTPKQVQATIESGLCLGLSLSHPQYFSGEKKGQLAGEPIEVSVCEIPAREGCYITKFNSYRYNTDDRGWIPGQSRGFDQVQVQASMSSVGDKDTKMTPAAGGGSGTAPFPTTPGMTPPAAAGSNQGQGSVSMDTDADDLKSLLEKNRENPLTMQLAKAFLKDKQKLEEKAKTLLAAEAKKNQTLQKKLAQADDISRRGVDVTHKLVESLLQKTGKQAALHDHRQQMDSNPEYREQARFLQTPAGQALMVSAEFGCTVAANQQLPPQSSVRKDEFLELTQGLWKSDIEIPDQHRSVSEAVPVSASSSSSSGQQPQRPRFQAPRDSRQELEDYYLKIQSQNLDKWTDKLSLNPVDIYDDDEADPNNPLVKHARNVQAHFEKNGQGSASKKRKLGATEDYVPAVHDGES